VTILREQLHEAGNLLGWAWRGEKPYLVSTNARTGSYSWAARLSTASGQVRSALQLKPNPTDAYDSVGDVWTATIGNEYWFGLSVYVPSDWQPLTYDGSAEPPVAGSSGGELCWQWQAKPDDGEPYRSPVMGMYISYDPDQAQYIDGVLHTPSATTPYFMLWIRGDTQATRLNSSFTHSKTRLIAPVLPLKGTWVDFVVHVKWHWNAALHPYIELWLNNAQRVYAGGGGLASDPDGTSHPTYHTYDYPNCSNDTLGPYHSELAYIWDWDEAENRAASDISARVWGYDNFRLGDSAATYEDVHPAAESAGDPGGEPGEDPPVVVSDSQRVFAVVEASCPTTTGNQTIEAGDLLDLTPQAALLVLSGATADDTVTAHAQFNVGATDGTNVWCTSWVSEDAQARTDTYATTQNDHLLVMQAAADGATAAVADFVAFVPGGITINWTDAPPSAYRLRVYLWAGIEDAEAGVLTTNATQDAGTTATVGFRPQAVLLSSLYGANETQAAGADLALGLAVDDGSATQGCVAAWLPDNQDTTYARGGVWQGRVMKLQTGWSGQLAFADDGFTVTTRDAAGAAVLVGYLAVRYGDSAEVALQVRTSKTTTGDQATTGLGFQPSHVLGLYTYADAVDTYIYGDHGISSFGIGGASAYSAGAVSVLHQHGVATSVAKSKTDDVLCNLMALDGTDGIEATLTSLDADGFTINHVVTNGTARYAVELWATLPNPPAPSWGYHSCHDGGLLDDDNLHVAGTLSNDNATIDADGNATLAGYVTAERLGSGGLANGATLTLTTALAIGRLYLYSAAITWSAPGGDVVLFGFIYRDSSGEKVHQVVSHASWTVALNGSHQLTFTNGTGTGALILTNLLRVY
jgi:hypothetical protein